MTHMTAPPTRGGVRIAAMAAAASALAILSMLLCFCSLFPAAVFLSFVFNALMVGSSLFATLAQEREKRTIDALRLTQLSSYDILWLKSHNERRTWARGNVILTGLMLLAGLQSGVPAIWVISGAAALAAGGRLSMALALAVSTRSETTSSAVVSGWVCKGAWLVGLPLLDQVVEAVFVTNGPVTLFRFLDPAWVALKVSEVSFFEPSSSALAGLWLGTVAMLAIACAAVWQSSRLIDSSFESAATLEDRNRHSAYAKSFPLGLHDNAFFVREMAWQMRSGAGRWPGYAVFFTLFLAPFLYGVAQSQKAEQAKPNRVIRAEVLQQVTQNPATLAHDPYSPPAQKPGDEHGCFEAPEHSIAAPHSYHTGVCLSEMMGLPVNRPLYVQPGEVSVITPTGSVAQLPRTTVYPSSNVRSGGHSDYDFESQGRASASKTALEYELGRGLLTGLLLTIVYLFIRGGAFMAGSVTGEKERRAWDQIALTGVSPESYIGGKLAAVLAFPVKQMLVASPALALFVAFGVLSLSQFVLSVAMLLACFVVAGSLGVATSTLCPTSHQAQGAALGISAGLLLLPMSPVGWVFLLLGGSLLIAKSRLSAGGSFVALGTLLVCGLVGGPMVSPLASVMTMCGSTVGTSSIIHAIAGPTGGLLWSTLSMAFFSGLFYRVAVTGLEDGGSVQT